MLDLIHYMDGICCTNGFIYQSIRYIYIISQQISIPNASFQFGQEIVSIQRGIVSGIERLQLLVSLSLQESRALIMYVLVFTKDVT